MIIHELVTNSSKYGALRDRGSVHVTLSIVPGEGLHFKWVEEGGPTVVAPTRRSFGSVIIERLVPFDLQGTATVTFRPEGLIVEFVIPERYVASSEESLGDVALPAPATLQGFAAEPIKTRPLEDLHLPLVEYNLIVALEAEDLLRTLGAASAAMVSSTAAALRLAGVPFIFASTQRTKKFFLASCQVPPLSESKLTTPERSHRTLAIAGERAIILLGSVIEN